LVPHFSSVICSVLSSMADTIMPAGAMNPFGWKGWGTVGLYASQSNEHLIMATIQMHVPYLNHFPCPSPLWNF
jgi:hypothetical protein